MPITQIYTEGGVNLTEITTGDANRVINYYAENYTDLTTSVALSPALGEIALLKSSEGTSWLPWSLGGTYYPSGIYIYDGASWVSSREAIADEFNDLTKRHGWTAINDTTYTSGSPFSITSGVDTYLVFNNDSVLEAYAPLGTTAADYFDDVNNRITTAGVGHSYIFRLTFKCVPANNSRVLNIQYDIGTGLGSQIPIDSRSSELRTAGVASNVSLSSLIYTLGTFDTNGMGIILNANTNCDIYDISMVITRVN